jgi:hypothetical protein
MRTLFVALLLAAACTPPAAPPAAEQKAEAPAPDLGPYANEWNSTEFVRFNHTLRAASPGQHALVLEASTDGGTETVAVYPADANGERAGGRIVFVVAAAGGTRNTTPIDVPEAGVPVVVVIENASGRPSVGSYSLTVE